MSVLKNIRSLSSMEFYHTAIKLRKQLTDWVLKDFGIKYSNKKYYLSGHSLRETFI